MLHSILDNTLKDKIRKEKILEKTKITDISYKIKKF